MEAIEFPLADPDTRLSDIKRSLPYSLDQLRKALRLTDVHLNKEQQERASFRLENLAYDWLDRLLAGGPVGAKQLVVRVGRLLESSLMSAKERGKDFPILELCGEANRLAWLIPLDIFPMVGSARRGLLGYAGLHFTVVRRMAQSPNPVVGRGPIPTKVFAYRKGDFDGINRQIEYFSAHQKLFAPLLVWPTSHTRTEEHAISQLARHLWQELGTAGLRRGRRRIIHFSCHYRLAGVDPEANFSAVAELGFDDDLNVGIPDLNGRMVAISRDTSMSASEALVFLNACQSASQSALGDGVVDFLVRRGFRNILASESLLPDKSAAAFALAFYELLSEGASIGSAVVRARRRMVEAAGNPIGLLYSLYGDPTLRFQ